MIGKLIVLEGIDGAGTTTQTARLAEHVRGLGKKAHATREPSDGPIGKQLRAILGGAHAPVDPTAIALLFAADRIDHLKREVEPQLAGGIHVITDRYVLSSLAYQSVQVDRAHVAAFNAAARRADLTLLLDVPAGVAAERRKARGGPEELFDALAFQEQVADRYRREAEALRAAGEPLVIIDGSPPADQVFAACARAVETCLAGPSEPS